MYSLEFMMYVVLGASAGFIAVMSLITIGVYFEAKDDRDATTLTKTILILTVILGAMLFVMLGTTMPQIVEGLENKAKTEMLDKYNWKIDKQKQNTDTEKKEVELSATATKLIEPAKAKAKAKELTPMEQEVEELYSKVRDDWKYLAEERFTPETNEIKIILRIALLNDMEDPLALLEIAHCESRFNSRANNPNSSAKGLWQFTDRTWNVYLDDPGSRYNPGLSTHHFMQVYKNHPDWWECNKR